MNRLKEKYMKEVLPKLQEEFGLKNVLATPRILKVVVSLGMGDAKDNAGILDKVKIYVGALAGQKPVVTMAKKSIAAFKVVQGQPVGMMVTLRGDKMYAFMDKFINVVLPKVRDFKGINAESFDDSGNINIGLKEQTIFPEVDYRVIDKTRGLAVTITTTAKDKQKGRKLLEYLGMPFKS